MFKQARFFFDKKNILEVDIPILSKYPSIDTHIEVMSTFVSYKEKRYLHTSPEYLMKRLLSENIGDIYFLAHVFRKDEMGALHNPEFTMAEWYRKNICYKKFLEETIEFINLFLPGLTYTRYSYRDIFKKITNIDCFVATKSTLYKYAKKHIAFEALGLDKDDLLNLIMSHLIEPSFKENKLYVIDNFPASQAALSKTKKISNIEIAQRFEIYFKGVELANGFHELSDAKEQKKRFVLANKKRKKLKKEELSIDPLFLKALQKGIGNCFGVAVGFDRLLMLKHNKSHIREIFPFF